MASAAQVRKIWAAAREIGLEESQLRGLIEDQVGSPSVSRLSFAQAGQVIETLIALGARAGAGAQKPSGRRAGAAEIKLISGPMRRLIQDLRAQLGDPWTKDAYFGGACRRLIKTDHPRTGREASRVVEMLKKRIAHAESRRGE